jgi:hypothetical protein
MYLYLKDHPVPLWQVVVIFVVVFVVWVVVEYFKHED